MKGPLTNRTPRAPLPINWLDYIKDSQRVAIPKGPRFQADVPDWTPQTKEETLKNYYVDSSRWLGTKEWEPKNSSQIDKTENVELDKDVVGKGRPDFCPCEIPGSVECIEMHLKDKKKELQRELGPAFWKWKFSEMGEDTSKLWTLGEQKAFEYIVKANPISEGKSFLKPAVESLHSQSQQSIVNYYFNVYLPRRMGMQIRSGYKTVDTDDEGPGVNTKSKSSRKRCQADVVTSDSSPTVKNRYLTGRR